MHKAVFSVYAAPPSGCLNIGLINKTDRQVTLRWTRPKVTGRDDFYYTISYGNGEMTGEHTLRSDLKDVKEVLSGLTPATTYTFTVTVHNGVSQQDNNEHLRRCQLTTATAEGSELKPIII